jgi:hypothetical protein
MADAQLKISIGGTVDPSLATATSQAADQINRLNETTQQSSIASSAASTQQVIKDIGTVEAALTQLATDMAALARAGTKGFNEATANQAISYKTTCSEILSAEGQLVSEIFSKRQSLAADLQKIGLRLVESEVSNTAKSLTQHEMYNLGMLASDKETSQQGLLYQLGAQLASLDGLTSTEGAKVAVKAQSVTTQTAVESSGNAVALAEQTATKAQVVASDADQAASGAYSSAAQIPYVGWLIAPAAAATAAAAVMAFAEGGQLRVSAAEQPTMLHKDEMVWPGWAAHGARNMLASFSAGDFNVPRGGDTFTRSQSDTTSHQWNYAPTIHGVPERDVMNELRNNAAEFSSFIRGLSRGGSMRFG